MVYTSYEGFYQNGLQKPYHYFFPHEKNRLLRSYNCFYGPSFGIRADVWQAVGNHRGKPSPSQEVP